MSLCEGHVTSKEWINQYSQVNGRHISLFFGLRVAAIRRWKVDVLVGRSIDAALELK